MQKPRYTPTKITPNIKLKQEALKKSRQRLIGSVFMLIVVLSLLLYVTSRVKPIPINPDVVEIKNTNASAPTIVAPLKTTASGANIVNASAPAVSASMSNNNVKESSDVVRSAATAENISTQTNNRPVASENSHGFRAAIINSDHKVKQVASKVKTEIKAEMHKIDTPTLDKLKVKTKVNPADILDNISTEDTPPEKPNKKPPANSNNKGKSYIQFAAMSTSEKANALQQQLSSRGISTSIEPIQTAKGTLYRLRAGPYSHSDALSKLQQISNEGYSGIVTGN